jgi:hypothetical protein
MHIPDEWFPAGADEDLRAAMLEITEHTVTEVCQALELASRCGPARGDIVLVYCQMFLGWMDPDRVDEHFRRCLQKRTGGPAWLSCWYDGAWLEEVMSTRQIELHNLHVHMLELVMPRLAMALKGTSLKPRYRKDFREMARQPRTEVEEAVFQNFFAQVGYWLWGFTPEFGKAMFRKGEVCDIIQRSAQVMQTVSEIE